ncbi:hypothetical protein B4U79_10295 [Dinothrombium tinctorium]|uniref:RRM domain-containing protein n=1 Tax=Dinothrombium tinctorium TaxID=1965070 RepID=A0A3S3P7J7_9ACAR|nr:hypothetical protein B4U79_10295 [Dinothrombium tinctorium]
MFDDISASNWKRKSKRLEKESVSSPLGLSNMTNSRSPNDLRSRIFIGNLNTGVITKRHLHLIFQQHGDIKAISMHKGYAFIQYGDEMDALNAVFAQDGQAIAGQAIGRV